MLTYVTYQGALALFEINFDSCGIYYAQLLTYEGDPRQKPPAGITLTRGIRKWSGSFDDESLLFQLGVCIEEAERI